jgi:AraC-like DNA-binding protein
MSQTRQIRRLTADQEPFLTARSLATTYFSGFVIEPHAHPWHQLLYACTGAMTVSAAESSWMIPPGKAVVIPARCRHSIRMWGDVAMRSIYVPETVASKALTATGCRVISVTPLLREIILRIVELAGLDSRETSDAHLMAILLDEIDRPPVEPLTLLLPRDARAVRVAEHVLAEPSEDETLHVLSRRYGASQRTLERLFRAETGMSFGLWRQKVRLLQSIRVLASGGSVTDAALESGYGSVSAYIVAFRQTFGCTPGAMLIEAADEVVAWSDALRGAGSP